MTKHSIGKAGGCALEVQECWHGSATWEHVQCTEEREYVGGRWRGADCFAEDSAWAMEERKVCNASVWVNLDSCASGDAAEGACNVAPGEGGGGGASPCLLLSVTVVPLSLEVEHKFGGLGTAKDLAKTVEADPEAWLRNARA